MTDKDDTSQLVLEATLDSFGFPAWISDDSGEPKFLNCYAKNIYKKLLNINNSNYHENFDSRTIAVDGVNFYWCKKALNHGTNYVLNELRELDELTRIKRSNDALDFALNKY